MRNEMSPTLELDQRANAAYLTLLDGEVASSRRLDAQRLLDMDEDGNVVGIEFLDVSRGVDLRDLPLARKFERLFQEQHIHVLV